MKTVYEVDEIKRDNEILLSHKSSKSVFGLYGARVMLVLESYILHHRNIPYTSIRLTYYPMNKDVGGFDWIDSTRLGILRVPDDSGGKKRVVEQSLDTGGPIHLSLLDFQNISDAHEDVARQLVGNCLRSIESITERVRTFITNSIASSLQERAIHLIKQQYTKSTALNLESLLGQINWPLLLHGSQCPQDFVNVVEYTTRHNAPTHLPIDDIDSRGASFEHLSWDNLNRYDLERKLEHGFDEEDRIRIRKKRAEEYKKATGRAIELMKSVCGEDLAEMFEKRGHIAVKKNDYTFILEPDKMVTCIDPNEKRATLCIHTAGFRCHPIDEVIIAYLYINNKLNTFIKTSNILRIDEGFKMPV